MNAVDPGKIAIRAVKRPQSVRVAFLDSVCGEDMALREKVDELIKVYEESGRFSDHVQTETEAPVQHERPRTSEGPGSQVGHYKLLQQVGEGGFGVVFMAEQREPVRRKVALKVVKPGMDTGEVIARFDAERQALALMDHPNIAKVLDAGTTDNGRPFFVMELVRGVSITEYCDRNLLSTRERLELFTTVCHAVQHAHQKGVIHRDLKPSNILVTLHDGKPVPKVIDFGVAKSLNQQLTQRTLFTAYGQVVGTPQYMSPEQAEMSGLDIDTRSDIYSLGVLLYELLTGSTPFDGQRLQSAGFAEMLRIIREEEPPKPSTRVSTAGDEATAVAKHRSADQRKLAQQLRGELDWVVMKSLEKDRNRRYANANGLAADLQRYLNDEPVSACPPSASYRAWKFAHRNKRLVAAAGAIGAVLLVGAVLSAVMAVRAVDAANGAAEQLTGEMAARIKAERARQAEIDQREAVESERDHAIEAQAQATRQRNLAIASENKAQANFEQARNTVDQYLTTVSENQLLTVPGMQRLRQELLNSALTFYDRFVAERQDDVQLRAGLGSAYLRLGEVHRDLREQEEAKTHFAKAKEFFEKLVRDGHESPDTLRQLADVYFWNGQYADAVTLCKRVLDDQPDNRDVQQRLANTYNTLAIRAKDQEERTESLRIHREALAIRRRLVELDLRNPEYLGDLSSTINNVGVLLVDQGEQVQAHNMYRLAQQYVDAAFARAPYSMLYGRFAATSRRNAASTAANRNLQEEALNGYQSVVDAWNLLAENNPAVASYKSERYQAYQALANYQQRIGRQAEAAATLRLARLSVENLPQETAADLYGLAKVYAALARSRGPEQQTMGLLAVQSLARAVAKGHDDLSTLENGPEFAELREREDCQRLLAVLKLEKEITAVYKDPEKREDVERIRQDLQQYVEDEVARISIGRSLRMIADYYERAGEFDESRTLLEQAVSLLEENDEDPLVAIDLLAARCDLGQFHWLQRDYPQAHQYWQACLSKLAELGHTQREDQQLQNEISVQEREMFQRYGRLGLFPLVHDHFARSVECNRVKSIADVPELASDGEFSAVVLLDTDEETARKYFRQLAESLREAEYQWTYDLIHLVRGIGAIGDNDLFTEELLSQFQGVFDGRSDQGWVAVGMAMVHYRHGRFAEAQTVLADFRQDATPQIAFLDAAIAAKLGDGERAQQRWSEGEARYNQIGRNALAHDVADNNKGVFCQYWWQFGYDQAMRRLASEAMSGEPAPADPWQHLIQARGYWLIGENAKAETELAAASNAAPEDAKLSLARARLIAGWDDIERAEAEWKKIIDSAGDDPMPWIHRGHWYAGHGEQEKSDADFAMAVSLKSDHPAVWLLRERRQPDVLHTWDFTADHNDDWHNVDQCVVNPLGSFLSVTTTGDDPKLMCDVAAPPGWKELLLCARVQGNQDGQLFWATTESPGFSGDRERSFSLVDSGGQWRVHRVFFKPESDITQLRVDPVKRSGWRVDLAWFVLSALRAELAERPEFKQLFASPENRTADEKLAAQQAEVPTERHQDVEAGLQEMIDQADDDPMPWLRRARWYASCGEYEKALEDCNKAIELDSGDAQIWGTRGYVYEKLDQWDKAINDYQRAIEMELELWPLWEIRAEGFAGSGQYDKAFALYTCRIKSNPGNPHAWLERGRLYARKGAHEKAISDFDEAIRLAPEAAWAYQFRATSYQRIQQHEKAIADASEAIRLNPAAWFSYQIRSEAYAGLQQHDKAMADASESIRLNPKNGWGYAGRAGWYLRMRQYDQAIADASEAIRLNPKDGVAYKLRADAYTALRNYDQALGDCDKMISLAPTDHNGYTSRAKIYAHMGEYEKSLAEFSQIGQAIELNRENVWVWYDRSNAYARVGQLERAIADYSQIIQLDPGLALAYCRRGAALAACGKWPEAIADAAQAVKLRPGGWHSHDYACVLLLSGDRDEYQRVCADMLNRFDGATDESNHQSTVRVCTLASNTVVEPQRLVQLAERAVATDPKSPAALYALGIAHYRAGQYEQAIQRLDESLQISLPDLECEVCAWLALAMAHHRQGDEEQARRWLDKALEWTEKHKLVRPGDPAAPGALPLYYAGSNFECLILLREAEVLIGRKTAEERKRGQDSLFWQKKKTP